MATILIVDDRSSNRQFLTTLLGYGGHRLLEAVNGAQALEVVRSERPDLVITDILMPTMDGFEFTQRLRDDPGLAATPVIFHTATYSEREAERLAKSCGVRSVVPKPCEPIQMLEAVSRELGSAAPAVASPAAAGRGADGRRPAPKPEELLNPHFHGLDAAKQDLDRVVTGNVGRVPVRKGIQESWQRLQENVAGLQRIASRLSALIEVGMEMTQERDPTRLLKLFFGAACEMIEAKYAALGILDDDERRLRHVLTRDLDPGMYAGETGTGSGLFDPLPFPRRALRAHGTDTKLGSKGFPDGHPSVGSVLAVAIATRDKVYGWLYFADRREAEEFSEEDERLAVILAAQLALLYEHAQLYDLIQRHAANLQVEALERKRAQDALHESAAGLHRAQLMAKLAHVITGPDGSFETWSETLPHLAGVDPAQLPASTREWLNRIHPEDRSLFRTRAIDAGAEGARTDVEYRLGRADGAWINVRQVMEPLSGATGTLGKARWFNTLQDVTEQRQVLEALQMSEERHRAMFENAAVGIVHSDLDGRIVIANPMLREMTGYSANEITSVSIRELTHAEDVQASIEARARLLAESGASYERELRLVRKDGSRFWAHAATSLVRRADSSSAHFVTVLHDISERKEQQQRIERLNRVYLVLSGINTLIVRVRERDELFREACRIAVELGRFAVAWVAVLDRSSAEVRPVAWQGANDAYIEAARQGMKEAARGGGGIAGLALREKRAVISNDIAADPRVLLAPQSMNLGSRALVALPLVVGGEAVGVLTLHAREPGFFDDEEMKLLLELAGDVSFAIEHIEKSEKADYLAYYDVLTGLANRTLFIDRLTHKLNAAAAGQHKVAVLLVDVERFKSVNDSLGRHAGDQLLKQIAERLRNYAPDTVEIARAGSDQFKLAIPGVTDENDVARFIEQGARECFGAPFQAGGADLRVRVKVGIAMYPNDGADAETLSRNSEAALERAKSTGSAYVFFADDMSKRVAGKLALEQQLEQALEKDEFVLHYQPKVDLESRRIVGMEALIRWMNAERGLVPPGQFIPLLEETGLIREVGVWAIRRAVRDHRHWLRQGLRAPRVAVNVSQIQLRQQDFVEVLREAIAQGANPTGIDLEITESMVMHDVAANIAKLKAVRDLGVSIAIDDFGTGYSSLGYLAKLPVQALKIDRSFIVAMASDPDAMTLTSTIISLAHSLRLQVIAEGVETEEQARMLRLLRCDQMQGYLFSRPLPFEEITGRLEQRAPG